MISYLEGRLAAKGPAFLIVDVGGVGFHLHIPLSSYSPDLEVGAAVRVLTHLHVREDGMALYGFLTQAERDLFALLISISGIGPPMALKVLSGVAISDFKRMIASEDARGLMRIKGVGQKLAQRLVVELKDRIQTVAAEDAVGTATGEALNRAEEAVAALVGLGANPLHARKAVGQVLVDEGDGLPVEELIRRALRRL